MKIWFLPKGQTQGDLVATWYYNRWFCYWIKYYWAFEILRSFWPRNIGNSLQSASIYQNRDIWQHSSIPIIRDYVWGFYSFCHGLNYVFRAWWWNLTGTIICWVCWRNLNFGNFSDWVEIGRYFNEPKLGICRLKTKYQPTIDLLSIWNSFKIVICFKINPKFGGVLTVDNLPFSAIRNYLKFIQICYEYRRFSSISKVRFYIYDLTSFGKKFKILADIKPLSFVYLSRFVNVKL